MFSSNTVAFERHLQSHAEWWAQAGVSYFVAEETVNWLEAVDSETALSQEIAPITPEMAATPRFIPTAERRKAEQALKGQECPVFSPDILPAHLDELPAFLMTHSDYPGGHYGGKKLPLIGPSHANLTIITDIASEDDFSAGRIFGGAEGKLLENMLRAIGLIISECLIIPLATSRPAGGQLPEADLPVLAEFARWQLQQTTCENVLLLGDTVSRAFLADGIRQTYGNLHSLNHNAGNIIAASCFHPKTLIARPALKREAWHSLQQLAVHMARKKV